MPESLPLVSVIIPTYNRLRYLTEAVGSVLAQTYPNWELIVVDDGSTDGTRDFLGTLADSRVTVLSMGHSGNPAHVRNAGIARARGEFVAFLDSDDLWDPSKLAVQLRAMTVHGRYAWSYTNFTTIDVAGHEIARPAGGPWRRYSGWILKELICTRAAVATPTVVVQRALLQRVGAFDETLLFNEDYDLWLRLASEAEVQAVEGVLVQTRHHAGRRTAGRVDVHEWKVVVYAKVLASAKDASIRWACRRRSSEHLRQLAEHYSTARNHANAFRTLARSWRYDPSNVRWWWTLAKACGRSFLRT